MSKASLLLIAIAFSITSWAKVELDASLLAMKNADQISELVRKKIKKAQEIQAKQEEHDGDQFKAEPEAVEELKAALRIIFGRPDADGTRANGFTLVRHELNDLNSLDTTLQDLSKEAISALKNTATTAARAGTYVYILENLMAEIKPEIKDSANFRKIIEEIRDANIEINEEVKKQQLIRSMSKPVSPSETAAKIIPKEKPKEEKTK